MKAKTGKYLGGTVLKGENRDNSLPPTEIGISSGFLKPMEYDVQRKIEY
jgi:hypothetical protein